MRIKAARLTEMGRQPPYRDSRPLEIVEVELSPPGAGEVRSSDGCDSSHFTTRVAEPRAAPVGE